MKKIYLSGNYVIVEKDGKTYEYAVNKSVYTFDNKVAPIYEIVETGVGRDAAGAMKIPVTEITANEWFLEDGVTNYTEATLKTFLRGNTGFKTSPGGRGDADTIISVSSANLKNLVGVAEVLLPAPGVGVYYSDIFIRFKSIFGEAGYAIAMDSLLSVKMGVIEKMINTELITTPENCVIEISDFFFDKNNTDEERPFANHLTMNEGITLQMVGVNDFTNGDGTLEVELWYEANNF